jgi:hypothetical protein
MAVWGSARGEGIRDYGWDRTDAIRKDTLSRRIAVRPMHVPKEVTVRSNLWQPADPARDLSSVFSPSICDKGTFERSEGR